MHFAMAVALYALTAIDAPVTDVTVYSDRARVTRTAKVNVSGTQEFELPPLLDRVDVSTVRVTATGAEVVRVDIKPVEPDALPMDEAKKLLADIEKLDDAIATAVQEQVAYGQQLGALSTITPTVPEGDPLKPPPKLDASGWSLAMGFVADLTSKLQTKEREQTEKLRKLTEQRQTLAQKAQLLGGATRQPGFLVRPTLSGNGPATIEVTYIAGPARWYPTYDLELQPDSGKVRVAFSGLVSQETGEKWDGAKLTLSTAEPATHLRLPELTSWKIGERDRFIPTPVPKPQYVKPAPPVPQPIAVQREEDLLRDRLMAVAQADVTSEIDQLQANVVQGGGIGAGALGGRGYGGYAAPNTGSITRGAGAVARPPPPPPPPQRPKPMQANKPYDKREEAKEDMDEERSRAPAAAPAEPAPELDMVETAAEAPARRGFFQFSGEDEGGNLTPVSSFSLSPPPSYRPPSYSPDLPAALSGGYDLAWSSLQKETIDSGKGARRVALFSQQWPVSVERRLYPALAPEAYLVAELKSPSSSPLPGGNAQLYVGADPAGTARLDLVAPGEKFTLPLGLDRAVKPIRNVELVTAEKGVIGKDDVSRYVVRTEILNPYRVPIFVKVFDQWPLTDDKDVEVKLEETKPWAIQDPVKGSLEWHLTIPAGQKLETQFTFSIRRPKNWRLHQQ